MYVWDFEADTFHELCTEKTHWTANDSKHDHEQSLEMVGACDENVR